MKAGKSTDQTFVPIRSGYSCFFETVFITCNKMQLMQRLFMMLILFSIASCTEKEISMPPPPPEPEMKYTDLQNKEVRSGKSQLLDLDGNGSVDFAFFVIHIGDPLFQQDKVRFLAGSNVQCNLLVGGDNNSPVLTKGSIISLNNMPPFEWYEVSEVFLAEKIIGMNAPPFWQGPWKDVSHKYLAIQIVKNNQRYNGWIELSFDTVTEKLYLHKAAISKEAEKEVKAGM
jgi:hypothetical protein